jgi:nucleoside-diphosphate-sugar epimerase
MKILVTGGGGFVGGYIVERLLARGYAVRSIGRSPQPELVAKGVEVVCGDLTDATAVSAACEGVGAVFHVAARAGVWGSWESFYGPNVIGTRNVLSACRKWQVKRLVYTSTPSVVFNGDSIRGGDESLPYGKNWLCHYAETKALAEQEALAANSEKLQVVALRPHLIFGPGDPHLLPRVVESVKAGRLRIVGDGSAKVDVSYVGNVADAHLDAFDALERGKGAGQAYFISQGEPVDLWSWLNSILEGLGQPPLTQKIPRPLAYGIGALCEGVWKVLRRRTDPPITRFVAVELAKDHYFDISKAQHELGYRPRVPMNEALKLTIQDLIRRHY